METGFVYFSDGKIPFVINDYRLELFSDESIVSEFARHYNFQNNYVLEGIFLINGCIKRNFTALISHSNGPICYIKCYVTFNSLVTSSYDSIGIRSDLLDGVFRYKYNYLDLIENGSNLSEQRQLIYDFPVLMNGKTYTANYFVGQNHAMGLLDAFNNGGELVINSLSGSIEECYNITLLLKRLMDFVYLRSIGSFNKIVLYNDGIPVANLFCGFIGDSPLQNVEVLFYNLDVKKYIPRIINNLALDLGNRIEHSIPLGHLNNDLKWFSPNRFIEQIFSFEYLFAKMEPKKANGKGALSLKDQLKTVFDYYPEVFSTGEKTESIAETIKETRRNITHGYYYLYDFEKNVEYNRLMYILDEIILYYSLEYIGFSHIEAIDYKKTTF